MEKISLERGGSRRRFICPTTKVKIYSSWRLSDKTTWVFTFFPLLNTRRVLPSTTSVLRFLWCASVKYESWFSHFWNDLIYFQDCLAFALPQKAKLQPKAEFNLKKLKILIWDLLVLFKNGGCRRNYSLESKGNGSLVLQCVLHSSKGVPCWHMHVRLLASSTKIFVCSAYLKWSSK